MCGIFSLHDDRAPVDMGALGRALDALAHRGPDGEGRWQSQDGRSALGHRRLSIIDLAGGAQPLHNPAGDLHIVVNGEFYGHDAIRRDLIARGHHFATRSDSEIALHLYAEYGLDFLHHLRGEFALVLVDDRNRRIVAARDRFGIKPLCYAQEGTRLYLSSEAKALLAAGLTARWDREALYHACTLQYTPADRTVFAGIRQLPPGHLLVHEQGRTRVERYWDLDLAAEKNTRKSDADWIAEFRDQLQDSVNLRLQADVPVCTHLSGGIDSATITALAAAAMQKPVDCFTVRFGGDAAYDEYPVAREMAGKTGACLHAVDVSGDDVADHLSDAVYYSEGLSINHHLAGKYLLNRAIRKAGYKVALSGEGADEMLAGYPHFREDLLQAGNHAQRQALYAGNTKLAGVFLADGATLDTGAAEGLLGFLPAFLRAKASLGYRLHGLLAADSARHADPFAAFAAAHAPAVQGLSRVDAAAYLWSKSALANYILRTLGDGCEMPHAVEGRVPFLDHRLFEFTRAMPQHLKINGMTEKYILREAARPLLTETLYRRQKHPFIAPPSARLQTPRLRDHLQDTLRGNGLPAAFDRQKTAAFLDRLDKADAAAQITAEPVLMTLLTATHLQHRYGLAA